MELQDENVDEIRFMEVVVRDRDDRVISHISVGLTRDVVHSLLTIKPPPRVICKEQMGCTDYPQRCPECANNSAKSLFKPRDEEQPLKP